MSASYRRGVAKTSDLLALTQQGELGTAPSQWMHGPPELGVTERIESAMGGYKLGPAPFGIGLSVQLREEDLGKVDKIW